MAPCAMRGHNHEVKVIGQREFRNNSASVMDAVEAGETYHVTRNGVEIAELRPLPRRRRLTAEELVERHRALPPVDHSRMRREADPAVRTSVSSPAAGAPLGELGALGAEGGVVAVAGVEPGVVRQRAEDSLLQVVHEGREVLR